MNKPHTIFLIILIIGMVIVACAGAALHFGPLSSSTGTLTVMVKDTPVQSISHIYLTISDIELQGSSNSTSALTFGANQITFDLLSLINVSESLGNATLPVGNYTMIRFTISSASATISGENVTLKVPSGEVKVPTHFEIAFGETTIVTLDITADQTQISSSNNLRPVVTGEVNGPI